MSPILDVVVDVSIEDPDVLLLITLSPLPLPRSSSSRLQRLREVGVVAQYEPESAVPFGVVDAEFGAVTDHPFVQLPQQQTVRIGEQRVHHKVVYACICWRTHCKQLQIMFTAANGNHNSVERFTDTAVNGRQSTDSRNHALDTIDRRCKNHRTIDLSHEEPKTAIDEFRFAGFIYTKGPAIDQSSPTLPTETPVMGIKCNWRACHTIVVIYNIIIFN